VRVYLLPFSPLTKIQHTEGRFYLQQFGVASGPRGGRICIWGAKNSGSPNA